MRYAIVSDVHANWQAWSAVRDDIQSREVDEIVCLGDVVGYGPAPARVLADLRAHCQNFVLGNHDAAAAGLIDLSLFNDNARRSAEWTRKQFDKASLKLLGETPLELDGEDCIFAHAETPAPDDFGYVEERDDAQACFGATDRRFIFIGHTHVPLVFAQAADGAVTQLAESPYKLMAEAGTRYLVNVGSVGDPGDGSGQASYCIFDSAWGTIEFRKVAFDADAFLAELKLVPELATPWFLQHRDGERMRPSHDQVGAEKVSRATIRVATSRAKVRVRSGALTAAPSTILERYKPPPKPPTKMDPRKKTIIISASIVVVALAACILIWITTHWNSAPTETALPPAAAVAGAVASQPAGVTIRLDASAEETDKTNLAACAMDGNPLTRWCAGDAMLGHWLEMDLGSPQNLGGMEILWEFPEMTYGANIEASDDERRWKLLAAHTGTGGQHIAFTTDSRYLRISVMKLPPKKYASICEVKLFDGGGREIKITRAAGPVMPAATVATVAAQQVITLQAADAKLHGKTLKIEDIDGFKNIGWWNYASEYVQWDFSTERAGTFEVEILFSLPREGDNNEIAIVSGKSQVKIRLHPTMDWTNYKPAKAGRIHLDGGPVSLQVRAVKVRGPVMNIRTITLRRTGD